MNRYYYRDFQNIETDFPMQNLGSQQCTAPGSELYFQCTIEFPYDHVFDNALIGLGKGSTNKIFKRKNTVKAFHL